MRSRGVREPLHKTYVEGLLNTVTNVIDEDTDNFDVPVGNGLGTKETSLGDLGSRG